ncbi:hypothetical protein V6N13_143137 [Hibiscus sabdariffa]
MTKRRLGIVYRNPRPGPRNVEGMKENSEERTMELGKSGAQSDKGKVVISGGYKFRANRTLQGKNKVCNPIMTKRGKAASSNLGVEEDEVSEATSPSKTNITVEAAS